MFALLKKLKKRTDPLIKKVTGRLPFAPWHCVMDVLHPNAFGATPPEIDIKVLETAGKSRCLQFDGKHSFWFPNSVPINDELWGEYLFVFWKSAVNFHYYQKELVAIKPGDVVIDLGACEGAFTRQALELGAAKVVCVEPAEIMVHCLNRTFQKEIADGKVIVIKAAVGPFRGKASFNVPELNPAAASVSSKGGVFDVEILTLDQVCEAAGLDRLDFVKADIEGSELYAFEGGLPVLKRFMPKLAICTYHKSYHFNGLTALLHSIGYGKIRGVGLAGGIHCPQGHPWLLNAAR